MTLRNPLLERLRRQVGFGGDDLDALEQACGTVRSFRAHVDISPQGARSDCLQMIVKGWAARYTLLDDGQRQLSALLLPGDVCDLDGLMPGGAHTGICTLTDCAVATAHWAQIKELMDKRPAILSAFWFLQGVQSAVATEWITGFGRRSADERMAHLLCELNARLAIVGLSTNNAFELPLTQTDLADALGLSSVHVNRTLQLLRARLAITWEHRWLTIHNHHALAEMCGFNPDYLYLDGHPSVGGHVQRPRKGTPASTLFVQ